MNWLFWHSSDVFIQTHIETIYKLKKFISKQVYVVNLHPIVMTLPFGETLCAIWTSQIGVANSLVPVPVLNEPFSTGPADRY